MNMLTKTTEFTLMANHKLLLDPHRVIPPGNMVPVDIEEQKNKLVELAWMVGFPPPIKVQQQVTSKPLPDLLTNEKFIEVKQQSIRESIRSCHILTDEMQRKSSALMVVFAEKTASAPDTDAQTDYMYEEWSEFLAKLKDGYLDAQQFMLKFVTKMYEDMVKALGRLSEHVQAGGENEVAFGATAFYDQLKKLYDSISSPSFPVPPSFSKEEINALVKALSDKFSPDIQFSASSDGKIRMTFTGMYEGFQAILDLVASEKGKPNASTASYSAWNASFDSLKNSLQSKMSQLMQTYSQSMSQYDNLINLLMGMMSSNARVIEKLAGI
ncbi:36 kDa membrane antigen [Serratia quinivorans]|uniref:IpaD/SipD/SspD family type III secretion system needle tip protein n=1 Tax=Serratia quinivorans TaxID=137545 RepID=UPI0021770470|nr:IpaD/SipD/SspD family type III secretion system needle tip protein [Serratia quinivorans]CAI1903231.1 36 kDa membrane antigen [Serratia quinivorans]